MIMENLLFPSHLISRKARKYLYLIVISLLVKLFNYKVSRFLGVEVPREKAKKIN